MPIKLLKNIKFFGSSSQDPAIKKDLFYGVSSNKHIVGAYVFPCKELKANQPLFNDGFPSVIFMPSLSDEVHLSKRDKTITLKPVWVCCGVIKDTQWKIPDELEYIMVLRFRPSSFYSIFNVDPSLFHSKPVCSLEDFAHDKWLQVINEMYQKGTAREKIAVMTKALSLYDESNYLPPMLQTAIDHIDEKKGNTTVSDLLVAIGGKINQKWLQRNFIKYIGLPPKKYISLQRFIYTYGQYDMDKSSDLLGAAMMSGYYDYNHFYKDFKEYIGISPSQYAWD